MFDEGKGGEQTYAKALVFPADEDGGEDVANNEEQ